MLVVSGRTLTEGVVAAGGGIGAYDLAFQFFEFVKVKVCI